MLCKPLFNIKLSQSKGKSYLYIHIAVILWGFTAILGDIITINAFDLVWWRVCLISLGFILWPGMLTKIRALSTTSRKKLFFVGVIIALHWICFYGSIKLANASIALITFSTTAFFTAILEPLFFKSVLSKIDVLFGILVVPAMILIAFNFSSTYLIGFWVGILSAFLAALFSILNKKYIEIAEPDVMTFFEMLSAFVFMSFLIPLVNNNLWRSSFFPSSQNLFYLIVLAIICTILPFILHLKALKELSAFTTNLIVNLEPIYGVIMAALILNEYNELDVNFYLGGSVIVVLVILYPLVKRVKKSA